MEWYQYLMVMGVPSLISGIMLIVINRNLARRDAARRREDEARELERRRAEKEREERAEAMEAQSRKVEAQNNALMLGVQAILRDRLLQGYRSYFDKGWADYDDRENLENVWAQYHALGANGIMDSFRARFLALPVTKDVDLSRQ